MTIKTRIVRRMAEKAITGGVFMGRYHKKVVRSARYMRNLLEYVLLNKSKHEKRIEYRDHYSSAVAFSRWRALMGWRFTAIIAHQAESDTPDPRRLGSGHLGT